MKNKKAFTVVELVIVIAIIAVLAAVLIPTFATIIKKANVSKDTQLIRNLNTALATDNAENGGKGHRNMTEALEAAEKFGYDVDKINASETDNEILWDSKNDLFCYFDGSEIKYIPESELTYTKNNSDDEKKIHDVDYWVIRNVDRNSNEAKKNVSETYSTYLSGIDSSDASIIITKGLDVGKTNVLTSITYENKGENAVAQEVVIRTNGGTLTVNAPLDTVKHYGEALVVTLTAVGTSSYYENGSVEQVNIKKGRLVLTNNEDASVGTIYLQATGDEYDNIILATQKGAKLPTLIARDNVSLPTGTDTKTVVTIQTDVDANGLNAQKTETINLYPTHGTTGNDVKEATNGYNVSDLALLVVEASSTDAKAQAAEQISDPEVVANVSVSKTAVGVDSEETLTNAISAKAKYINVIESFNITNYIDINISTTINGGNHTITCESGVTRILRVTANDVNLKLQNLKFIGHAKTERGIQVDPNMTGVNLSLINVEVSNVSYYGVNICSGVDVDIYMDACTITAWGALNLWSAKYDVVVKNSTLNGINDKKYDKYGWNDFATIVLEGDTTGKTNDHSSVIDVKLINTTITATSTKNNKQALFGFNSGATANNVSCENCTLKLDNSIYTYNYYDDGEGNKLFINDEQIDIGTYYNDYLLNTRGYDAYICFYYSNSYPYFGAYLTLDDALSQSKLYVLSLKKDVTLDKNYVLQGSAVYDNLIFIQLEGHNLNAGGQTLKITNGTVVVTDSYDSLLTLFSADEGYHVVEDTNGNDGPFVYLIEADE